MADEKQHRASSSDSKPKIEHQDRANSPTTSSPTTARGEGPQGRQKASVKAENPLTGLSEGELIRMVDDYCDHHGFDNEEDLVRLSEGNHCIWIVSNPIQDYRRS